MEVSLGNKELIKTKRIYLNSSQATTASKKMGYQLEPSIEGIYTYGRLTYDIEDALVGCDDDEILTVSVVKFSCINNFLKFGQKKLTLSLKNQLGAGNFFEFTYNAQASNYLYNSASSAELIDWLNAGLSSAWNTETGSATFRLTGASEGHQYISPFIAGAAAANFIIYGEDDPNNPAGVVTGTSRELMRMLGLSPSAYIDLSYDNTGATPFISGTTNIQIGSPTHFLITSSLVQDSYANTDPPLRNVLAEVPLDFKLDSWSPLTETWRYQVNWENINMVGSHKELSHKNISSIDLDIRLPNGELCNFANSDYNIELEFKTLSRYKRN
jgi:hypothetical protein